MLAAFNVCARALLTAGSWLHRRRRGSQGERHAPRSGAGAAAWAKIAGIVEQWSREHVVAVVATALVAALLVAGARRRGEAWATPAGRALAIVILGGFIGEHLTYAARGDWTARVNLPLHLTDAVTLASIAALWRPGSALLVELVYFWAFSASLQAVLTPDLGQSFPDVLFFTYFVTHSGAVAAASLLVLGAGHTPRPDAAWRVYGVTVAVLAAAGVGTLLTGGNYMFVRHKPAHGSLLDLMGPWPIYIFVAAIVGLLLFLALARLARLPAASAHRQAV